MKQLFSVRFGRWPLFRFVLRVGFSSMATKQHFHKEMLVQVFGFLQIVNLIHIEINPIFGSRIDEVA